MARPAVPSSQKALLLELKGLQEEPVEGFRVGLVDEGDLYTWDVAIFGPPDTHYEGGYFKVSGGEGRAGGVGGCAACLGRSFSVLARVETLLGGCGCPGWVWGL